MSYNSGVFTLFNSSSSVSNLFINQNLDSLNFSSTVSNASVYGTLIQPSLATSGTGSIGFVYGQALLGSLRTSTTVNSLYGLNIAGPTIQSGRVVNCYSLFVTAPTQANSGLIGQMNAAFFGLPRLGKIRGGVGIGTTTPFNALDVAGGVVVGNYAGVANVSAGTLAISMNPYPALGVNNSNPQLYGDIQGTIQATTGAYGWMPQWSSQQATITQEYNMGYRAGGSEFLQRGFSSLTARIFNSLAVFGSLGSGFNGAVFDGTYVYYVPNVVPPSTVASVVCRYQMNSPFTNSTSYAFFDLKAVSSSSYGCQGGLYDGTYVYFLFISTVAGGTYPFIRYDTRLPFSSSLSYSVFTLNPIYGLAGGIYDGRYIYFCSGQSVSSIVNFKYDTLAPFTLSSSYVAFTYSRGYRQQVQDGQYIYYVPNGNPNSNMILRYDSTKSFSASTSYQTFDFSTVLPFVIPTRNILPAAAVFDGRFIYYLPNKSFVTTFVGMVRFDTNRAFNTTASYVNFNLFPFFPGGKNGTTSWGCYAGMFDGRYIYLVPSQGNNLNVVIYDTTKPFGMTSSYTFLDVSTLLAASYSFGFAGAAFDGRHVYLVPGYPNVTPNTAAGTIVRLQGYTGQPITSLGASSVANNGFTIGTGIINMGTTASALAGSVGIPSFPVGYIILTSTNNVIFKIPFYN